LETPVTGPLLSDLEEQRRHLFEQLAGVGDFRRGSVSKNYRRCGKPNCVCAGPGHPGHGPRLLWTRTVAGRGSRGRQLDGAEVDKVRAELANYHRFADISAQIVEVNEAICEARAPGVSGGVRPGGQTLGSDREKGGSTGRSWPSSPPR
jgi:hypothetical protein